jgi:peptidoglycan hydrolase CwlO-like protein
MNKKITLLIFVSIILLSSVSKASISSELTEDDEIRIKHVEQHINKIEDLINKES